MRDAINTMFGQEQCIDINRLMICFRDMPLMNAIHHPC
jgi:hypothetical protein